MLDWSAQPCSTIVRC